MAIRLLAGADLTGLKPEMMIAVVAAANAFQAEGADLWITSVTDGTHSRGSLHYSGLAVDLRRKHVAADVAERVAAQLKQHLSPQFDVILESTHIHIEYQPKRPT